MNVDFINRIASVADAWVSGHYPENKLEDGVFGMSDLYDGLSESFIEGYKHGYKDAIQSACNWLRSTIDIPYEGKVIDGMPVAEGYLDYLQRRSQNAKKVIEEFKNYMEETQFNN